jgi:hypothetical protein
MYIFFLPYLSAQALVGISNTKFMSPLRVVRKIAVPILNQRYCVKKKVQIGVEKTNAPRNPVI